MAVTTAITTAVGMRVDWRPVVECLLAGVRLYIQFKKDGKDRERERDRGWDTHSSRSESRQATLFFPLGHVLKSALSKDHLPQGNLC